MKLDDYICLWFILTVAGVLAMGTLSGEAHLGGIGGGALALIIYIYNYGGV